MIIIHFYDTVFSVTYHMALFWGRVNVSLWTVLQDSISFTAIVVILALILLATVFLLFFF